MLKKSSSCQAILCYILHLLTLYRSSSSRQEHHLIKSVTRGIWRILPEVMLWLQKGHNKPHTCQYILELKSAAWPKPTSWWCCHPRCGWLHLTPGAVQGAELTPASLCTPNSFMLSHVSGAVWTAVVGRGGTNWKALLSYHLLVNLACGGILFLTCLLEL